jgi:hypothetical protein
MTSGEHLPASARQRCQRTLYWVALELLIVAVLLATALRHTHSGLIPMALALDLASLPTVLAIARML